MAGHKIFALAFCLAALVTQGGVGLEKLATTGNMEQNLRSSMRIVGALLKRPCSANVEGSAEG